MRMMIRLMTIAFVASVLHGCAAKSPADTLYEEFGGFDMRDENPKYAPADDAIKTPDAHSSLLTAGKAVGTFLAVATGNAGNAFTGAAMALGVAGGVGDKYEHHWVFGASPLSIGEDNDQANANIFSRLKASAIKTAEDMGLTVTQVIEKERWEKPYHVLVVTNPELGCMEANPCAIHVYVRDSLKVSVDEELFPNIKEKVWMNNVGRAWVRFRSVQNPVDERVFYETLSRNLPEHYFVYLASSEYNSVKIGDQKGSVVAYPYILSHGEKQRFLRVE